MKDFFKRNKIVAIVILITLIIIVIFLYCISLAEISMEKSENELLQLKSRVTTINNYLPTPIKESSELLKNDISSLKKRLFEIENVFGNIYAKPLLAYTNSLKKSEILNLEVLCLSSKVKDLKSNGKSSEVLTEQEKRLNQIQSISDLDFELDFIQSWNRFMTNLKNSSKEDISVDDIFNSFRKEKGYDADMCKIAMDAFLSEFSKNNVEKIGPKMQNEYLLAALGVPIEFNKIKCKALMTEVEKEVNNKLKGSGVSVLNGKVVFFEEVPNLPQDGQISRLVDYTRFLGDLFSRVATSKLSTIKSYTKLNGIMGQESGGFVTFKYQIEVVGSLTSIRNFLNSLQNAYVDDRIYVIKSLSILDENKQAIEAIINADKKSTSIDKKARVILGGNNSNLIRAKIIFEYIIYKQKMTLL